MDLGNIVIPTPDRLASQAGVVQSGGGGVVEALDVRLVGLEEIEGHRLEAADNRHALGHPPNVPARYAHEDAFLVRHIPPGKYELSLRARGHRVFRKTIDVVSGGVLPALTVILEPAPCIQGLVTDAATGGPVGQAEIRLRAGERVVGTAYTDGTGLYRVTFEEDVREGELRLQISRPGYAPGEAVVPVRLLSVARPYEQPVALKVRPEE